MNGSAAVKFGAAPALAIATYCVVVDNNVLRTSDLTTFFATCAQVLATFFIALALLSSLPALAHLNFRQIVGAVALVYLGVGVVAATVGTLDHLPAGLYRVLFALTAGAGLGTLSVLVRFSWVNIKGTAREAVETRAQELGK